MPKNDGPAPTFHPVDLTQAVVRTRQMLTSLVQVEANSYRAVTSALGGSTLAQAGKNESNQRHEFLRLFSAGADSPDVIGVPTWTEDSSTVPVQWVNGGRIAKIYFKTYFMLHTFSVPLGSRALVPVEPYQLDEKTPAVIFRFSNPTFVPIKQRKKSGKSAQTAEATSAAAPAPAKTETPEVPKSDT
jgi:hypothetical protein